MAVGPIDGHILLPHELWQLFPTPDEPSYLRDQDVPPMTPFLGSPIGPILNFQIGQSLVSIYLSHT
jgi:hypothetical protein